MKKIIAFVLSLVALISLFTLSACSSENSDRIDALEKRIEELENSTVEYEEVELSLGYINHYLSVNITISECIIEYIETDLIGNRVYNLFCIVTFSTTRATNCHFEGTTGVTPANIQYNLENISTSTGWNTKSIVTPRVPIGYNGESSFSFPLWKEGTTILEFPTFFSVTALISGASGKVLVTKEA